MIYIELERLPENPETYGDRVERVSEHRPSCGAGREEAGSAAAAEGGNAAGQASAHNLLKSRGPSEGGPRAGAPDQARSAAAVLPALARLPKEDAAGFEEVPMEADRDSDDSSDADSDADSDCGLGAMDDNSRAEVLFSLHFDVSGCILWWLTGSWSTSGHCCDCSTPALWV